MPRLSVVTAVLRNPEGLERTIESLAQLKSSLQDDLETIVIDSSPDTHLNVRLKYEKTQKIRWIDSKPEGIYMALNQGSALASGNIIWHLHSGDWISSPIDAIRALIALEQSHNPLLVSDVWLARNDQTSFIHRHSKNLLTNLRGLSSIHHQGVLFKRELFQKVGPFSTNYSLAGDYEFFLRITKAKIDPLFFEGAFVTYDTGGRSLTGWRTILLEVRSIDRAHPRDLCHKILGEYHRFLFWLRLGFITPILERLRLYDFSRKLFYLWKR